jgi:hypothetical protein
MSSITSLTSTAVPIPANCPVSYAVSGTELAPLAQELRAFRDQAIARTRSGLAFMILFNSWYYSFAPSFASHLELHSTQREFFRYVLYPLIGILYVSKYVYLLVSPFSADGGVITAGIVAASLLGLIYIAPIGYIGLRVIRRYVKWLTLGLTRMSRWSSISVSIIGVAYLVNSQFLGVAIANLLLSMLTLSAILGIQALSCLQQKRNSLVSITELMILEHKYKLNFGSILLNLNCLREFRRRVTLIRHVICRLR